MLLQYKLIFQYTFFYKYLIETHILINKKEDWLNDNNDTCQSEIESTRDEDEEEASRWNGGGGCSKKTRSQDCRVLFLSAKLEKA